MKTGQLYATSQSVVLWNSDLTGGPCLGMGEFVLALNDKNQYCLVLTKFGVAYVDAVFLKKMKTT